MRIEQLEYWDKDTGWKLARTSFFPDLTLLVRVSGVGKTKILKAIRTLKRIVGRDDGRLAPLGSRLADPIPYRWEAVRLGRRIRSQAY